eukprot:1156355-Pelagomonas_calceolata.AAC.10
MLQAHTAGGRGQHRLMHCTPDGKRTDGRAEAKIPSTARHILQLLSQTKSLCMPDFQQLAISGTGNVWDTRLPNRGIQQWPTNKINGHAAMLRGIQPWACTKCKAMLMTISKDTDDPMDASAVFLGCDNPMDTSATLLRCEDPMDACAIFWSCEDPMDASAIVLSCIAQCAELAALKNVWIRGTHPYTSPCQRPSASTPQPCQSPAAHSTHSTAACCGSAYQTLSYRAACSIPPRSGLPPHMKQLSLARKKIDS